MIKLSKEKFLISSFIIFSVIIFDQISKFWALRSYLVTACNNGFAFGLARSWEMSVILTLLVLVVVVYFLIKEQNRDRLFGLLLIVAGGFSNILDRVRSGCVVDFVKWPSQTWLPLPDWLQSSLTRWPAFNLADAAISVGVAILIISIVAEMKAYQKH